METIELNLDEKNDLVFQVSIEGEVNASPQVRLVCENDEISHYFKCKPSQDGYSASVPAMKGILEKGDYNSKLEVIIENKYFVPLEFKTKFKEDVKVVAESNVLVNKSQQTQKAETVVKASPVKVSAVKPKEKSEAVPEKPKAQKRPPIKEQKKPEPRKKQEMSKEELRKLLREFSK